MSTVVVSGRVAQLVEAPG